MKRQQVWRLVWVLSWVFVSCGASHAELLPFVNPVHLGCERDQVRLGLFTVTACLTPLSPTEGIVLEQAGRLMRLQGLNQLRGLVRIVDGPSALRFVRLRTSPATWHTWPDRVREVEVVASSHLQSLPTFGLPKLRYPPRHDASGYLGILSDTAYRGSQFTPPMVEEVDKGFRVSRWIYRRDLTHKTSVQQVQEVVMQDGAYRRTVITQMPPPDLPGVLWELPVSE
jgi:hypothetical protein